MLRAIGRLDNKIEAVDKKLDATRENLDTKIDAVNENLDTKIDTVNENLDSKITEGLSTLRASMEAALGRVETRLTSLENRTYDIKPGPSSHTG